MNSYKDIHRDIIKTKENTNSYDLDFTDDSIKKQVDISPLKSGGASFKTNVLIQESKYRLVYKPYVGVAIFCFIFLAIGLGLLFFSFFPFNGNSNNMNLTLIVVGLIFTIVGSFMFYSFYKPRVFDKQLGLYYRAYNFKPKRLNEDNNKGYIPLSTIIAIQIIGEHVNSDNGSYRSFELNLVLDDNSRRNVVDHGHLKSIINDAHILSKFLNVPIWHAASAKL